MARKVKQSHRICVADGTAELNHGFLHGLAVCIKNRRHVKADFAQRGRQQLGVVGRIDESAKRISGVANYQSSAASCCSLARCKTCDTKQHQ